MLACSEYVTGVLLVNCGEYGRMTKDETYPERAPMWSERTSGLVESLVWPNACSVHMTGVADVPRALK